MRLALAVVFASLIAAGAGLVFVPAGLITAGVLGLSGMYVHAYLSARAGGDR